MQIATWNINGIRARLPEIEFWLKQHRPEIVCLQEIKIVDEIFPRDVFENLNYNVEVHGQKGFNGVAILSLLPFDEVNRGLPGDEDDTQARFIEGVFSGENGRPFRVACIYLPNGNPVDSPKFPYKLAWMDRLIDWTKQRLLLEEPLVIAGDYNIIPAPIDTHSHDEWWGDALYRDESLERFRALERTGMSDALRAVTNQEAFTFWDFQAGAWRKNHGIRIDHILCSPQATDRLESVLVCKDMRGRNKPSDHVPVIGEFCF